MATAFGFMADVIREEAEDLLTRSLAKRGYRERLRLRHSGDAVFPELAQALEQHPGSESITWFSCTLAGSGTSATVFHHRYESPRRWDPVLVRRLTEASGGFGALVEINRTGDEYGLGVFYSGHTLELLGCDSEHGEVRIGSADPSETARRHLCDDEYMYGAFEHYFNEITGGLPADLRLQGDALFESWIVERDRVVADPYAVEAANGHPVCSWLAFANIDETAFRAALSAVRNEVAGWTWVARETPIAKIPYVLMRHDAPQDGGLAAAIANGGDCFVLGIELRPPGAPFEWLTLAPGTEGQRGQALGAAAFIDRWSAFAITMGEPPGSIRWASHAGEGRFSG